MLKLPGWLSRRISPRAARSGLDVAIETLEDAADKLAEQAIRGREWMQLGLRMSPYLGDRLVYEPGRHAGNVMSDMASLAGTGRVLDFGCGRGQHRGRLESLGFDWWGVDYGDSIDPAAVARHGSNLGGRVRLYDGLRIPDPDQHFAAVWSHQSFEHVQQPEMSMAEVARVLRPGGIFAGAVSFLEPYHAESTYSYTPYGFMLLCERHGLDVLKIYPLHDGVSLAFRTYLAMLGLTENDTVPFERVMAGGGIFTKALVKAAGARGRLDDLSDALGSIAGHFLFVTQRSA